MTSIAQFLGFVYLTTILIAFLLQTITNYRKKSTCGFSTDYGYAQLIGFILYLFNQTAGWCDRTSDAGRVHAVDLIHAVGCVSINAATVDQTMIYPSDKGNLIVITFWVVIMTVMLAGGLAEAYLGVSMQRYLGFSWLYWCTIIKAVSVFIKFSAQVF